MGISVCSCIAKLKVLFITFISVVYIALMQVNPEKFRIFTEFNVTAYGVSMVHA